MQLSWGQIPPPAQKLVATLRFRNAESAIESGCPVHSRCIPPFWAPYFSTLNSNPSNADARWASACRRLDDGNSLHFRFAKMAIESGCRHQTNIIRTRFSELEKGSDYLFISPFTSKSISQMVPQSCPTPSPGGHARRKPDNEQEQPQPFL